MADDFEARLAAARAKKAELDARSAAAELDRAAIADLERLERENADAAALLDAEAAHGRLGSKIAAVYTDLGVVIVKRPNMTLFRKFQDEDPDKVNVARLEQLVRPCVVHPDSAAFDRILDELPAALPKIASAVCGLAGARSKEAAGK